MRVGGGFKYILYTHIQIYLDIFVPSFQLNALFYFALILTAESMHTLTSSGDIITEEKQKNNPVR